MSLNLLVAVEQRDHDDVVRPMILTRFMSGITGTATVSKGDFIEFEGVGVILKIYAVIHKYGDREKAPCTNVYGEFDRSLWDDEIDALFVHGFSDMKGVSIEPNDKMSVANG